MCPFLFGAQTDSHRSVMACARAPVHRPCSEPMQWLWMNERIYEWANNQSIVHLGCWESSNGHHNSPPRLPPPKEQINELTNLAAKWFTNFTDSVANHGNPQELGAYESCWSVCHCHPCLFSLPNTVRAQSCSIKQTGKPRHRSENYEPAGKKERKDGKGRWQSK